MDLTDGNGPTNTGFRPSDFFRSFARTARAVILEPARFFRRLDGRGSSGSAVLFAVVCLVASFLLVQIAAPIEAWLLGEAYPGLGGAFWVILALSPLLAWLVVYVTAAFQHLLVMAFARQRKRFHETLLVSAYASALALLNWVPVVGYLASAYGLYVTMLGLKELHGTSTGRALLAVLVPALVFVVSIVWGYWF